MKLLKMICKELGVEIGEEWEGFWTTDNKYPNYTKFKFTETELLGYRKDYEGWFAGGSFLSDILYGRLKPVGKPEIGDTYFAPDLSCLDKVKMYHWHNRGIDRLLYKRGQVFETKEEAVGVANKMIKAIKGGKIYESIKNGM